MILLPDISSCQREGFLTESSTSRNRLFELEKTQIAYDIFRNQCPSLICNIIRIPGKAQKVGDVFIALARKNKENSFLRPENGA